MRSVHTTLAATLALALPLLATAAQAGETIADDADASRPFVVKVHADWCGTCTALNPTWDELQSHVGGGARLVILDVTDRDAFTKSQAEAERLGLGDFFAEYKARTGTIAVLRGDNREKVEVMKGVRDVARYEAAIAQARGADPS
jgi:thiol-disulfide isomerase/thioredoxin